VTRADSDRSPSGAEVFRHTPERAPVVVDEPCLDCLRSPCQCDDDACTDLEERLDRALGSK